MNHDSGERRPGDSEIAELVQCVGNRRTLVLTGAGISTESGIPDYRSPKSIAKGRKPIQYRDFMGSGDARRRYWARSSIGWSFMRDTRPNNGHLALAKLERSGRISGILTQNVDGLHQKAGSRAVLELHGGLRSVVCTDCDVLEDRDGYQSRLESGNPGWRKRYSEIAPDGDASIPNDLTESFYVPSCLSCGGVLKPNIVFFGENVPGMRVSEAWRWLDNAEALLVAGSSLAVYSGFRFVRRAIELRKPVAIVNRGPTRGDDLATVRVEGSTGDVLARYAEVLAVNH